MKLKIRKVEVTPEEFFEALTDIIKVHEKIPAIAYIGSNLSYICKTMGIKLLEFWQLKFENEKEFTSRFAIIQMEWDRNVFHVWRKEVYDYIPQKK